MNKLKVFLMAAVLVLISIQLQVRPNTAFAELETVVYTDVLEDLHKDDNFDETYYPEVVENFSLYLIQIAESSDKELFVYIYQPSGQALNLRASYIRFSTNPKEDIAPKDYSLRYLNSSGVFYKYIVEDFTVLSDETRFYGVVQIMRPWIKGVDPESGNDNIITQQPFSVDRQYTFGTLNEKPYVREEHLDTIEITDKWVGFCRYPEGGFKFGITDHSCDAHFVAFNTNKPIDKLISADLYYSTQRVHEYIHTVVGGQSGTTFGDVEKQPVQTITGEKVEYSGKGWFANKYSWNRIETINEFIATESRHDVYKGVIFNKIVDTSLKVDVENTLRDNYAWVLRFTETDYTLQGSNVGSDEWYTNIEDVTILRLSFVTAGSTYNLGVIDNMQSEPADPEEHIPANTVTTTWEVSNNLWWILGVILGIILIIILWPFIRFILELLIWLISLPFKGIKKLVDKRKSKRSKE